MMSCKVVRSAFLHALVCSFVAGLVLSSPLAAQPPAQHGLNQAWYLGRTNNRDEAEQLFEDEEPALDVFVATHGNQWWFGHQFEEANGAMADFDVLDSTVPYPEGSDPPLELGDDTIFTVEGNQSFNNYTVHAWGLINIPQSGTYQFADGIDDYTFLAIDADKSGVAGDTDDEVIIDDNDWTDADRDRGTLAGSLGEIDLNVAAGGEWLALEFYMSEGGGHDAGLIYWDYDVNDGIGAGEGFPQDENDPIDIEFIVPRLIPDTHLWSGDTPPAAGGAQEVVVNTGIDTTLAEAGLNGPDAPHGAEGTNPDGVERWEWDGSDGGGVNHGLLWFDIPANVLAAFGDGTATLAMHVDNNGNAGDLHRVTSDWLSGPDGGDEVTWNNIPGGPGIVPGQNAEADSNAQFPDSIGRQGEVLEVDVTEDVKAWAAGAPNYGWGIVPVGGDGHGITSFENASNPVPTLTLLVPSLSAALQAGDANQDLEFNQLDLVAVQIAGTYLTGNPATWGSGDWNGAPGGSVGNPPAGNGLFDQVDIIAALNAGTYLTGPYAAVAPGGVDGDGQTSIGYDPGTGQVWVDAPAGTELTSVNIDSAGGIFTGEASQNLGGSFDNDADGNIFKATFGGSFGTTSFGNVAQAGLSQDFLLSDLTVVGSLAGGGDLGAVDLIYVPEPGSLMLLMLGVVGFACLRRRR